MLTGAKITAMSQELCARGRELFKTASQADELFKARLLEFFSGAKKDDQEMKRIINDLKGKAVIEIAREIK